MNKQFNKKLEVAGSIDLSGNIDEWTTFFYAWSLLQQSQTLSVAVPNEKMNKYTRKCDE